MSSISKAKKIEELNKKLFSADETIALAAIADVRENGTLELVSPLISLFATSESAEIKKEAAELLSTLKISGTEKILTEALANPSFRHIRKDVLQFIWSSGIEPVDEVANISRIAVEGSFEEALECVTLLESMESAIPEAVLLESITMVKQYLGQPSADDKKALITEYLRVLENMIVED